jgi:hypothetical protein
MYISEPGVVSVSPVSGNVLRPERSSATRHRVWCSPTDEHAAGRTVRPYDFDVGEALVAQPIRIVRSVVGTRTRRQAKKERHNIAVANGPAALRRFQIPNRHRAARLQSVADASDQRSDVGWDEVVEDVRQNHRNSRDVLWEAWRR